MRTFKLKVALLLIAILSPWFYFAQDKNDTTKWKMPTAKLLTAFAKHYGFGSCEVLKLYDDLSYEYIDYNYDNFYYLILRTTGTYSYAKGKLKLYKNESDTNKFKNFREEYYLKSKKGLYTSKFSAFFTPNKPLLGKRLLYDFRKPFYLSLLSNKIIKNPEAPEKINLRELVNFITKNKKSDREKVMEIISFIKNSIEYGHAPDTGKFAYDQKDVEKILAGRDRVAVCAGYSNVFTKLCEYAGIKCRNVFGYAKNSKYYADKLGGYHAWNIVTIDGKEEIYDVTWADGGGDMWLNVNPELMVYSHLPDHPSDQLISDPIKPEFYFNTTHVYPESEEAKFIDFSPKMGTVFADTFFRFTLEGPAKILSVTEVSGDYFNVGYNQDKNPSPESYKIRKVANCKKIIKDGKTIIDIPVMKNISCVTIHANGCDYTYKLIKGDLNSLFETYVSKADKNNLDPFIKGVLGAIKIEDAVSLSKLVGLGNPLFFEKNNKIKKYLKEKFKSWDGNISQIIQCDVTEYVQEYDETQKKNIERKKNYIENAVRWGSNTLVFEKNNKGYLITKIK
ncbi:MAG: transglutaminase domain-containing protein [Bacteroidota bacterium]|jgi:hypothetical protein